MRTDKSSIELGAKIFCTFVFKFTDLLPHDGRDDGDTVKESVNNFFYLGVAEGILGCRQTAAASTGLLPKNR